MHFIRQLGVVRQSVCHTLADSLTDFATELNCPFGTLAQASHPRSGGGAAAVCLSAVCLLSVCQSVSQSVSLSERGQPKTTCFAFFPFFHPGTLGRVN